MALLNALDDGQGKQATLGYELADLMVGLNSSGEVVVNGVARFGGWMAGGLFAVSLGCWMLRFLPDREAAATAPF